MQVEQIHLGDKDAAGTFKASFEPDLILGFISPGYKKRDELIGGLSKSHPNTILFGCSTAGEICDVTVHDDSAILSAVRFEHTKIKNYHIENSDPSTSFESGKSLGNLIDHDGLRHVFVLSDGLNINGADLVDGIRNSLPESVSITGGLAGDGANFGSTFVISNGTATDKQITALAFYGDRLKIGYGSMGGWDSFGLERLVTKATANVLYELDNKPALEIYKSYLGEQASGLPGTGLLFPLSMREHVDDLPIVRTILGIDEEAQSLTFAGNIPEGAYVRLMKANIDRLIDGAEDSAKATLSGIESGDASLVICISCVGRRLVLKQMVEEEVEAVRSIVGDKAVMTGYYSYGEIAPFKAFAPCQLHNQTMTVTTFAEI